MEYEDYFLEEDKIYMSELNIFRELDRDRDYSGISYTPLDTWQWLLTENQSSMSPEDRIPESSFNKERQQENTQNNNMEAQLVDVTPEESKETDRMLEDYLKGFNEGIDKLMDKEKLPTNVNDTKETAKNENLVLLIDENVILVEKKQEADMERIMDECDLGDQYGEYQSNTRQVKIETNETEQKTNIKKFIQNMDELNEKMDKLVEKDNKRQGIVSKQIEHEIKKQIRLTKLPERSDKADETTELINVGTKESDKKEDITESKDANKAKENLLSDTLQSNLTVLEQTYTLEEYHRRFERKCEKERKALEEMDLKEMETHGVHECNADLHEDQYNSVPYEYQNYMGMTVTSGIITIQKDSSNLIGISIGGGAPLCPCLYIVQVFDNTPAAKEGTLQSGDEVVGVNGMCVKGKTKVEVAKMIQSAESEVSIKYNKLHADPQQGKSLDIVLKKVKHRLVENMSTTTADALGLSRAILCNDTLVKKMEELESTEQMYKGLVDHCKKVLKGFLSLLRIYKDFGDAFAGIGVREPQPRASEAFRQFGEYHRTMEKNGIATIKAVKPILSDLGTYLNKAIPDTKLTIRKYADTKFEYLSYCLKVKEMDDEEYSYAALQEPLYRVETGNYEYRLILRCRQDARLRFAALRSDVLVKLELLDNKHVQDVVCQLQRLIAGLASYHSTNIGLLRENSLFPIEMDLSQNSFQYECNQVPSYENDNDDDQGVDGRDDDLIIADEVKPDDENDESQTNNQRSNRSEYADLLRELESSDNTNLLDL